MQAFLVLALAVGNEAIRAIQDRLCRAVILLQRNDAGRRGILRREPEDILDLGSAKRVDRLCVIANDRDPGPVRFQRRQDLRLQQVGVLVLVNEHVIEPRTDLVGKIPLRDEVTPVEKQVVVVERLNFLLALHELAEQGSQLVFPLGAPGKGLLQRVLQ